MILQCYIDADTEARLKRSAAELGRTVEDLAESAIAEAALYADPTRGQPARLCRHGNPIGQCPQQHSRGCPDSE